MNKYILDEQFSKLSTKRIQNMITLRIEKDAKCSNQITELEIKQENCSSDDYYDSLQSKIDKLQNKMDDISDWMVAARPLFSSDLWNELVDYNQCYTD